MRKKVGKIISYDCRKSVKEGQCKRLVQWNIERGYKLEAIKETLRNEDVDVICLQEVDIGCLRSGNIDVAFELAKELEMVCVFVEEFEEIYSDIRKPNDQGGGLHGNAILCKFDLDAEIIEHEHDPVDWDKRGIYFGEPRRGRRRTLVAKVKCEDPFLVYSVHLEVFCGILDRITQFADILDYANQNLETYPRQAILGDLNTMAHGIARFAPRYCSDGLRWKSLFYFEAEWWHQFLFSFRSFMGDENTALKRFTSLDKSVLRKARNPDFYDPWHPTKDVTLINYRGFYFGKLDWTLLRGFRVVDKRMENNDYSASDHKLLFIQVEPSDTIDADFAANERTYSSRSYFAWIALCIFCVAIGIQTVKFS